ncbi:MAG TPA: hypothetical protein VES20_11690 [Bryobacteraceae bacterium]|nr:hypothetical protein [Bryobacteraceae bacterium]
MCIHSNQVEHGFTKVNVDRAAYSSACVRLKTGAREPAMVLDVSLGSRVPKYDSSPGDAR